MFHVSFARPEHHLRRLRVGQPVIRPTSISADAVNPQFLTNSSESVNGITSSPRLCGITVSGFAVLTVPYFLHAGQISTSFASPLLMFIAAAPIQPDDDLRLMFVELGQGDPVCLLHVFVGQRRVDDFVAVVLQERRLDAARDRVPAVEEKNGHQGILASLGDLTPPTTLTTSPLDTGSNRPCLQSLKVVIPIHAVESNRNRGSTS